MKRHWRILLAALSTTFGAVAGDLQWWNDGEFSLLKGGRVEWVAEVGLRLRDEVGELYDRRASTSVEIGLGKGIAVSGGFMVRNSHISGFGSDWNTRIVGEVEYMLRRFGQTEFVGTTAYERQMGEPLVPDFNRYRQRFELESGKGGFSPWLYQDFMFVRRGFVRSRSRLGAQWRSRRGYVLGVAYQFEALHNPESSVTTPRHTVYATITIEKPLWTVGAAAQ